MKLSRVMLPLAVVSLTGCATSDELEAMKAAMNSSLVTTKRSLENRLQQLEQAKKRSDEEYTAQMTRLVKLQEEAASRLAEVQHTLAEQRRELTGQQEVLHRIGEQVKDTTRDLADVRGVIQGEDGALAQLLEAEETVYREGIRHVQRIRGELMSVMGRSVAPVKRRDVSLDRDVSSQRSLR